MVRKPPGALYNLQQEESQGVTGIITEKPAEDRRAASGGSFSFGIIVTGISSIHLDLGNRIAGLVDLFQDKIVLPIER
jgi:hypothetical protein